MAREIQISARSRRSDGAQLIVFLRQGDGVSFRSPPAWEAHSVLGFGADRLSIYLNDHLAGATLGVNLARRAAGSNRETSYGPVLEELAGEIEEDRRALLAVMERLEVGEDHLKIALAWGAEKFGRLKLNGELLGYSPLSRLEELEALSLGVEGKLALWRTLRSTHGEDPRLAGLDLDELIGRAQSQRRRLERRRLEAAGEALR